MNSLQEFIKTIQELAPQLKQISIYILGISVVYELIKFIPVYLVKLIVDNIFVEPNLSYLLWLVAGVFASLTALIFIEVHKIKYTAIRSSQQEEYIIKRSFLKTTKLPLSWHEDQNTGNIINKITKASQQVNSLVWFLNNELLPSTVQIVLTAIILTVVDYRIGLIYIVFTPIMMYLIDHQYKKVQPIRELYHESHDESTKELAQTLYNIQTVYNYGQEHKEYNKQKHLLGEYVENISKRANYEHNAILLRDTLTNLVRAGTLALSIYLVYNGIISPGDLVLIFTLTEKAYMNLYRLGRIYSLMGDSHEALKRAVDIQNEQEIRDEGTAPFTNGDIEIKKVDFAYNDSLALKNINATFKKNTFNALVGPSGSGKTTLVRLLMRHFEATKGTIQIDGKPIQEIPLTQLRKNIAFVSQETQLFDRTIHQNIAYTNKTSRKHVIQAAKQANAHEFINELPNGYNTVIGEQGVKLSGGQRQRISIARALLANAPIIVFDEATSSLDTQSEQAIQEALLSITDKTLIVIAHRLSTIEQAQNIFVLKHGRIIEQGTHEDLTQQEGLYANMQSLQQLGELRE